MPQPFPNHLVSIPQSIVSFKHYFRVHDQGFGRTALYGVILAVLVTALDTGVQLMGFLRELPKLEAHLVEGLEKDLAPLTFKDGKAISDAKQPTVLRQEHPPARADASAPEGAKRPAFRVLVVDTTGGVTTWEKAAEVAGCPEPQRMVLLGQKGIVSADLTKSQQEGGGQETWPYTDQTHLAEVKKLIEDNGGKFPEFSIENGLATFKLEPPKVHVLAHNQNVLALVDAAGKGLQLAKAYQEAVEERPEMHPPAFLVLVTATGATLKPFYNRAPIPLEFESRGELSPAIVGRWVAAAARQGLRDYVMRGITTGLFNRVLFACFELLVLALICSVGGLIVSAFLRAGFPFGQLFTMAVYAMTPARFVSLILVLAGVAAGQWALVVPIAIGVGYTGMATYRTARELGGTAVAPAPKL